MRQGACDLGCRWRLRCCQGKPLTCIQHSLRSSGPPIAFLRAAGLTLHESQHPGEPCLHRLTLPAMKVALEVTGEGIDMDVFFAISSPFGLLPPQQRPEALPLTVADPEDACSPLGSRHFAGKKTDRWLGDLHARGLLSPFLPCLPHPNIFIIVACTAALCTNQIHGIQSAQLRTRLVGRRCQCACRKLTSCSILHSAE